MNELMPLRQQKASVVGKLFALKYASKSTSAADDEQIKREIEIAVDAAIEMIERYHQLMR